MPGRLFYAIAILTFWWTFGFSTPASANCTWYNLQNGYPADATQVMADFNCIHGNLEIDPADAGFPLSIVGSGSIYSLLNSGGSGFDAAELYRDSANNNWAVGLLGGTGCGTGNWAVYNTACRLVIDMSGNLGIGTSTPAFPLSIVGSLSTYSLLNSGGSGFDAAELYRDSANNNWAAGLLGGQDAEQGIGLSITRLADS